MKQTINQNTIFDQKERQLFLESKAKQIKDIDNNQIAVKTAIIEILESYGYKGALSIKLLQKGVELIVRKYGTWSIDELHYSFEFESVRDGGSTSTYGEGFNLKWLTRILNGWNAQRNIIKGRLSFEALQKQKQFERSEEFVRQKVDASNLVMIENTAKEYAHFLEHGKILDKTIWRQRVVFFIKIGFLKVGKQEGEEKIESEKSVILLEKETAIEEAEGRSQKDFAAIRTMKKGLDSILSGIQSLELIAKNRAARYFVVREFESQKKKKVSAEKLKEKLIKLYEPKKEELSRPCFRLVIKMKTASDKEMDFGFDKKDAYDALKFHQKHNAKSIKNIWVEAY